MSNKVISIVKDKLRKEGPEALTLLQLSQAEDEKLWGCTCEEDTGSPCTFHSIYSED